MDGDVSYLERGIFQIAYDSSRTPTAFPPILNVYAPRPTFRIFARLLQKIWQLDRRRTMLYYLCNLWKTISPALSLYFGHLLVSLLDKKEGDLYTEPRHFPIIVYAWLSCGLLSYGVEVAMINARLHIGGRLRAYFIPRLVEVCLDSDVEETDETLPHAHDYGNFVPGWDFFDDFFSRLRQLSITFINVIVLFAILWQRQSFESVVAGAVMALLLIFAFCAPTDGVKGSGYTFWTENAAYNRLMVLFNIVFDPKYRLGIVRDGLSDMLVQEYQALSDELGAANIDVWALGWGIPSAWYWGLARVLIVGYPTALYALVAWYCGVSLSIGSLAFFQYAVITLRSGIDTHMAIYQRDSFYRIISRVQHFYDLLEKPKVELQHPSAEEMHAGGMNISTRGLSYSYLAPPGASTRSLALDSVDFDIGPGQMVLITGENGSGKTTLVKLLTGMLKATNGSVSVDGLPLSKHNAVEFRDAIVFLGQSEVIYPVSIKENITMGLGIPHQLSGSDGINRLAEEAAKFAGASEIIQRLGRDIVTNPCSINGYSILKTPGRAAVAALRRHSPTKHISLTDSEQQRVIAARALFRAMNSPRIKLVVLDECTSALDAFAESEIVMRFQEITKRRGLTLIVVTHRLPSLGMHADLILCLKEGRVESIGTPKNSVSSADG